MSRTHFGTLHDGHQAYRLPSPWRAADPKELGVRYNLVEAVLAFVDADARTGPAHLLLAALLKTRRDLGYFPAPNAVHAGTVAHLGAQLGGSGSGRMA
jgi:hypothetical protein